MSTTMPALALACLVCVALPTVGLDTVEPAADIATLDAIDAPLPVVDPFEPPMMPPPPLALPEPAPIVDLGPDLSCGCEPWSDGWLDQLDPDELATLDELEPIDATELDDPDAPMYVRADPQPGQPPTEEDLWKMFQDKVRKVSEIKTTPKELYTKFSDAEKRAFKTYREDVRKVFSELIIQRDSGKITDEEFRGLIMGSVFAEYKQAYAECGERTILVAAAAAWTGYEVWDVPRRTGGHEFPVVVRGGKVYLVEAWPGHKDDLLFREVTLKKGGKAIPVPTTSDGWDDVDFFDAKSGEQADAGSRAIRVYPKAK